jgi:hypothetical protein
MSKLDKPEKAMTIHIGITTFFQNLALLSAL